MRTDLLALTPDDLAALTNRGAVKRAQRELDETEVTGTIAEDAAGAVTATWSDGPACTIAAGSALRDGRCTCASATLCRHLVRTVLAYQKSHAAAETPSAAPGPWDPGTIGDDALAKHFRAAALSRHRATFDGGVVAELTRGAKPVARFHHPQATVRFLVPGDVRYTHCDCAEEAPCPHVPLAVWAFRRLPAGEAAGLVSTAGRAEPVAPDLIAELDGVVAGLLETGFSGATPPWADRVARLEVRCRKDGLAWPADILEDLAEQYRKYATHDAAFAPDRAAELLGELLLRRDAIVRDTGALPQLLVRGSAAQTVGTLGKTRLVGLGCRVTVGHRETEIVAYLQDTDTGGVVVAGKETAHPDPATNPPPPDFARLAHAQALKGSGKNFTFRDVARGQLLIEGGQRTAGGKLRVGRAGVSLQPQAYAWETLPPPTFVEDYAILRTRIAALPPSSLRPRRAAEDFFVLAVHAVEAVRFDGPSQTTLATLRDAAGNAALLRHPYTDGGRGGTEALLAALAGSVKFVSGVVRVAHGELTVEPCAVVVERERGREVVLPWIDAAPVGGAATASVAASEAQPRDTLTATMEALQLAVEELLVVGLRRADAGVERRWLEVQRTTESAGLTQFGGLLAKLVEKLAEKRRTARWDVQQTAEVLTRIVALLRLVRDAGAA